MKRVRQFNLIAACQTGNTQREITGWHKTWEAAVALLTEGASEVRLHDIGNKANGLIAIFSSENLQALQGASGDEQSGDESSGDDKPSEPPETSDSIRWVSEPITAETVEQQACYANRNHSDFGWRWIDGSQHEVPYRLTFIERKAERNPDGIWARGLGLVAELRDMLRVGGSLE
jgi:hypothetical protein